MPLDEDVVMDVRGRDEVAGLPRTIRIHANEVVEAITEPLEALIGAVRLVLEETPPELSSDIIDKGMIPKVDSAVAALRAGVEKVSFVDGRVPHSVLMEIFTDKGVGTEIVL